MILKLNNPVGFVHDLKVRRSIQLYIERISHVVGLLCEFKYFKHAFVI